nr:MG2 domain-containing protein [Candidatus Sigynarchaeota archaeon]
MTNEDLRVLFKVPEEHERIFEQFYNKGGPIINKILNALSTWREAPQVFVQYSKSVDFTQHFKARLFIVDSNFQPIKGAKIQLFQDDQGRPSETHTGDGGAGIIDVDIQLPKDIPKDASYFTANWKLVVEHAGRMKDVPLQFTGALLGEYGVYIFLDRLIYKPGQKLLAKIIAWQQIDGIYRINHEQVKLVLLNGSGKKLFVKRIALDEFGCCHAAVPLSKEIPEGPYQVQVRVGTTVKTIPIKIDYFKKPTIEVKVNATPDYILPGSDLEVRAEARYFWEEPVSDAEVRIAIEDETKRVIAISRGMTGADGVCRCVITVPPSIIFKEGSIKVTVTDTFDRTSTTEIKVPFSTEPFHTEITKEFLKSGEENKVLVRITKPNKKPVENARFFAFLECNAFVAFAEAISNVNGVAELAIDLLPVTEPVLARLRIECLVGDARDIVTKDITVYPPVAKEAEGIKEEPKLVLEVDGAEFRIGDVAHVSIHARTGLPVYLVIKTSDVLEFEQVQLEDDQAVHAINIDRRFWGNITVQGYTLTRKGDLITAETVFKVNPSSKALDVRIDGLHDRAYRPGDRASLAIGVLQDGKPVEASVAVALVDASVLALGVPREDPVECFFSRERQGKQLTTFHTWNRALHVGEIVEFLEMLNYLSYLDQDTILSTIYTLAIIDQHNLIDKATIETCMRKIVDAVVRHSTTKTPLWLLLEQPDSSKFNGPIRFELAMHVLVNWLDQGEEGKKIKEILDALGDLRKKVSLAMYEFSHVFEQLTKMILEKCPGLSIITQILYFIDDFRDMMDPGILNTVNNMIIADVKKNPLKKTLSDAEYQKAAIIFKPGSIFIAVGFEGMIDPVDVPRCLIGYPKYTSIMTDVEHYTREYYVDETSTKSPVVNKPPVLEPPKENEKDKRDGKPAVPEPIIVSLRKWFPETALWLPDLTAKGDVGCKVPLIFPDEIGRQDLAVVASTKDCEVGIATRSCTVHQDFFVKVNLPARICLGDDITFSTLVTNNSNVDMECAIKIEAKCMDIKRMDGTAADIIVTALAGKTVAQKWRGKVKKVGPSIVTIKAESEKYTDVVEHPIDILPPGQPVIESSCIEITRTKAGEFRVPRDPLPVQRTLGLSIVLDSIAGAIDGTERLIQYPHGCNEQVSAAILAAALAIQYLEQSSKLDFSIVEDARSKIERGLQELLVRRNQKNAWSWYAENDINIDVTIQILEALAEVEKIGYGLDKDDLIPTCNAIRAELVNLILAAGEKTPFSMGVVARAHDLFKTYLPPGETEYFLSYVKKNISRVANDKDLALACLTLLNEREEIKEHLGWLRNRAKVEGDLVHWTDDRSVAGDIGATAAVIRLLSRSRFDDVMLKKARRWILKQWDGNSGFGSTAKNIEAIRALLTIPEPRGTYDVKIAVNGVNLKAIHVTPADFEERSIELASMELPVSNEGASVAVSISSDIKDFTSVATLDDKKWYAPSAKQDVLEKTCPGVSVTRKYDKLLAQANEPVACTLQLVVREKQPVLVVEDQIPAGFIVDVSSIKTQIIHETSNNQIKFTLTDFDGETNFAYNLIPTIAGNFIVAGAKAYAMYERKFVTWTPPSIIKVKEQ